MSAKKFPSVWDAIEETPAKSENMKLRSKLMTALKGHINRVGLNQVEVAKHFRVTQPRISDLMRGKIISSDWMSWSPWRRRPAFRSS